MERIIFLKTPWWCRSKVHGANVRITRSEAKRLYAVMK